MNTDSSLTERIICLANISTSMQPGHGTMNPNHQYEIVSMKKGCCDKSFEASKIQNVMNQQAAAGRTFVWMQHESQSGCCSTEDSLLLVFRV